jgi:hypothetical protein
MNLNYSALNFSFASAEAQRLAFAERGAEETVAANLRQAAQDGKYTIGATITARYQYKVAEDGTLVPTQTQITTGAPDDALTDTGRRAPRRSYREDERQPKFTDFLKPRALLSPSDELSIFASFAAAPTPFGIPLRAQFSTAGFITQTTTQVTDENGETVEAELITPTTSNAGNAAAQSAFAARAQTAVAGLYARNADIIYNITPVAQFAA